MQHDLYSWQVMGDKFVKTNITNASNFFDNTITNWLLEVSKEQREEFIDTIFDILNTTNVKTVDELSSKWFRNAITIIKSYKNLNPEIKKMITRTFTTLLRSGTSNITKRK